MRLLSAFAISVLVAAVAVLEGEAVGAAQSGGSQADNSGLLAELGAVAHKILWETYDRDNWELFVMNADGTGRRNLTNTPNVHEMYPQASPDGSRICFVADVQTDGDTIRSVYYMNADGTGRKLVAEKGRQPCWSSDGTRIAFAKQEFERFNISDFATTGLYFYDLETGETTAHPNNGHPDEKKRLHHLYNPVWSGDGKWIVSTVHAGMGYSHGILAIEVDGDRVLNLRIEGCRPNLSPDSTKITWSRDDRTVCVADIDFSPPEPKVSNARILDRRPELHLYHPDFSPDGRYIVYSVGPGGRVSANGPGTHTDLAEIVGVRGKWNLYLKRVDDKSPGVQLTSGESATNKEPEWLAVYPGKEIAQ